MLAQGKRLLSESDDPTLTDSDEGRVQFMQYNFFHPQPLRDVSAFFIRQCTHNWCDRDVVAILRGFVPGLEGSAPGTPLLINDTSMLGPLSPWLFPLFLLHYVVPRYANSDENSPARSRDYPFARREVIATA